MKETKTCTVCTKVKPGRFYGKKDEAQTCKPCYDKSRSELTKVVKSSEKLRRKVYVWAGE